MRRAAPPSRRVLAAALCAAAMSGCATHAPSPAPPPVARCDFASCGMDAASLVKITADAIGKPATAVSILQAEQQFSGAVLIWRADVAGRQYDCKEGRGAKDHAVHYVDCRPSSDKGPLKAFP